MRIYNKGYKPTPQTTIDAAVNYMADKQYASFDDIRQDIPAVSTWTDAEISQVAKDAGFEVLPE